MYCRWPALPPSPLAGRLYQRCVWLSFANVLQALEVGLTPGGVARHLINLALLRHGKGTEQLPPPAQPETAASAQWAQATRANDSVADITQQLADAAVEAREQSDNAALQVSVVRDAPGPTAHLAA